MAKQKIIEVEKDKEDAICQVMNCYENSDIVLIDHDEDKTLELCNECYKKYFKNSKKRIS